MIYLPPVICFTHKMHYVDVKDKEDKRSDHDPVNNPRQVKVLLSKLYLNWQKTKKEKEIWHHSYSDWLRISLDFTPEKKQTKNKHITAHK